MRTRMSQGREFMNWVARNQNWREHVEKLRIQVTVCKDHRMPLMALIEHVYWNGICLYWQMDKVGIPIPRYLAEVERLLHLGTHSVIPRNQNALSLGGKIFGAHLFNAFGLATIDIVRYLEGVRPGLLYSWEPAAAVPAARPAGDVADDADEESTELYDLGEALHTSSVNQHYPKKKPGRQGQRFATKVEEAEEGYYDVKWRQSRGTGRPI